MDPRGRLITCSYNFYRGKEKRNASRVKEVRPFSGKKKGLPGVNFSSKKGGTPNGARFVEIFLSSFLRKVAGKGLPKPQLFQL